MITPRMPFGLALGCNRLATAVLVLLLLDPARPLAPVFILPGLAIRGPWAWRLWVLWRIPR